MKATIIILSYLLLLLPDNLTAAQDLVNLNNYTQNATTYRCGNPSLD